MPAHPMTVRAGFQWAWEVKGIWHKKHAEVCLMAGV
jgi:hypothetical protein